MEYKIFIYLIFILKFSINKNDYENSKLNLFFEKDINFCPLCFAERIKECRIFEKALSFSTDLKHSLNSLFGSRQIHYATLTTSSVQSVNIVIKHIAKEKIILDIQNQMLLLSNTTENSLEVLSVLKLMFLNDSRVDGCQLSPHNSLSDLLKLFDNKSYNFSDLELLLFLNVNVEPLLLSILNRDGFAVPQLISTCGFTIFETYEGESLINFKNSQFVVKLEISKQLIKAGIKFTDGYSGFRFYLTDITYDNIVYNDKLNRIAFIDLDNVIIVNSKKSKIGINKHEFIECSGCFAYDKEAICAKQMSDFNIFAVCQFLREDLYRSKEDGFLGKIPDEFTELSNLLDYCIECPAGCDNRLSVGNKLLNLFERFLR